MGNDKKIRAGLQEIQQAWQRYQHDLEHFVASLIGVGLDAVLQRDPEHALQLQTYLNSQSIQWVLFSDATVDNTCDLVIPRILNENPLVAQEILIRVAVPMAEMIAMARRIQLDLCAALHESDDEASHEASHEVMLTRACSSLKQHYLNENNLTLFTEYMSHVETLISDLNDLLGAAYKLREFKFPPLPLRFSVLNLLGCEVNLDDLVNRQVSAPALVQTDHGLMLYTVTPNDRKLLMLEDKISRAINSLIRSSNVSTLSISLLEHADIYRELKSSIGSQCSINQKSWTDLIMMPAQRYSMMVASINELSSRVGHDDLSLLKAEILSFSEKINRGVKEKKFELTSKQCCLTWSVASQNDRFGVSQLSKLPGIQKLNLKTGFLSIFKPEPLYCVKSNDHEFKINYREGAWHIRLAEPTQEAWRMSANLRLDILNVVVNLARSLKPDDFQFSDLPALSSSTRHWLNSGLCDRKSLTDTDDELEGFVPRS